MFKPLRYDSGKLAERPATAAQEFVKYQLAKMSSGLLVTADAGDAEAEYIVMEGITVAADSDPVLVLPIDDVMDVIATTATTPVQATHVGNDYDIGSNVALDLTATTDKVFHVEEIYSASDKQVLGRFNKPAIA